MIHSLCGLRVVFFFFFRALDEKERLNSLEVGLEQSLLYGEVTRKRANKNISFPCFFFFFNYFFFLTRNTDITERLLVI